MILVVGAGVVMRKIPRTLFFSLFGGTIFEGGEKGLCSFCTKRKASASCLACMSPFLARVIICGDSVNKCWVYLCVELAGPFLRGERFPWLWELWF